MFSLPPLPEEVELVLRKFLSLPKAREVCAPKCNVEDLTCLATSAHEMQYAIEALVPMDESSCSMSSLCQFIAWALKQKMASRNVELQETQPGEGGASRRSTRNVNAAAAASIATLGDSPESKRVLEGIRTGHWKSLSNDSCKDTRFQEDMELLAANAEVAVIYSKSGTYPTGAVYSEGKQNLVGCLPDRNLMCFVVLRISHLWQAFTRFAWRTMCASAHLKGTSS